MNKQLTLVSYQDDLGVSSTDMELIKPVNTLTAIGGGSKDDNWLAKLPVGTRFLFKNRFPQNHSGPDLGVQYAEVQVKYNECTQLYDGLNKPVKYIVMNLEFSQFMRCVQVLEPLQQKETDNVLVYVADEQLNRPDQP